ncbi:hypothetical protein [Botrimarina mediterranea]|uniref:Uncharacterized protein n=1 Tax=Botrimarina mediterranea TaxID=2528022 RepID=A0A518K9T5_9BACT|nr:hypothetical protein [Botrimarina mediterranea]QDV74543.1 hypothetical protein Spa11_27470 [Botrimarina mediterranea]QDV79183.1 hypothetical protein K2D_27940 [Planctomycetes bacterium K2D]
MRHLPENYLPGDQLEVTVNVKAELVESEATDDGRLLTVRVLGVKNRSNGMPVLWNARPNGALEFVVEVGAKQRLLAVGLSARQRESLKERLAGLTADEASELVAELALDK